MYRYVQGDPGGEQATRELIPSKPWKPRHRIKCAFCDKAFNKEHTFQKKTCAISTRWNGRFTLKTPGTQVRDVWWVKVLIVSKKSKLAQVALEVQEIQNDVALPLEVMTNESVVAYLGIEREKWIVGEVVSNFKF